MNLRPWVAASLAGAAIALASAPTGVAAQTPTRHASGFPWLQEREGDEEGEREGEGEGRHHHHNPWRHCFSPRRVVLIDRNFRAILTNSRRGPEALVLQGSPSSSSAPPEAPWNNFTVSTYMDVNYPTQTSNQYEFKIHGFFREHPVFVVKAFDRHERVFPFPAAHCVDGWDDDHHDGDRGDHARPHDGEAADGGGPSGAPSPQEGDHHQNGQPAPEALASGGTNLPLPPDDPAAGRSAGRLSAKRIGIAAGSSLLVLGVLATAWLRRRRRQRAARPEQEPAAPSAPDVTSHQEPDAPPAQPYQ